MADLQTPSGILRLPWLYDRHSHVSLYGAFHGCTVIAGLGKSEALKLLRALPTDGISVVLGWHNGRVSFTSEELQPLPPAILVNLSLHGYLLTGSARDLLAKTQPDLVLHAGELEWCERHLPQILEYLGRQADLTPRKLEAFMTGLQVLGFGAIEDMLLSGEEAFQVIQASPWGNRIRCWVKPDTFQGFSPEAQREIAGLKFFTDGALGAWTAAIRGTYRDGRRGILLYQDEEFRDALIEVHALAKPLAIHAIGSLAIEQVLGVLEGLHRAGLNFPLVRLEHVQFMDEVLARRAKALGLVLSMQPNFSSDSVDYADRLETAMLRANNPFRMLIDRVGFRPGHDLILGSDGMPHGIEYALQWSLFPAYPDQRLTLDEVVAGYGVHPEGKGQTLIEVDPEKRHVRLLESRADR